MTKTLITALALTSASLFAVAQSATTIERVKLTDNELSCAQIHGETLNMDKAIAEAKTEESSGNTTALAGTAGNVAAEVAGRTGLFGQIGGMAGSLFGKTAAKTAAEATTQSGQQNAQQSAERGRQASARKETLSAMFQNRGCKATDLSYNPPQSTASAAPAPAATAETPSPKPVMANAAPTLPNLDPDTHFKGKMGGTFGKNVTEVLPNSKRVAVAGFRVVFVTKDSATAQVRASSFLGRDSSGARMTVNAELAGVDPATLQAITDKAHADFLAQLKLAGREVLSMDDMKEFLAGVDATPTSIGKPYTKEAQAKTGQVFSPTGMPLWFSQWDATWGDRGLLDQSNHRRLAEYSQKFNAITIAPLIVVNFAKMSSSGNQSGLVSRTAEADATPGMNVSSFVTSYIRSDETRSGLMMKGDEGGVQMVKAIDSSVGFGTMKEVAVEDNKAVKGIFDALGKAAGMANAGGANRATSNRVMQTSNADYSVAAGDVLGQATGTFAKLFQKYPSP